MTKEERKRITALVRATEYLFLENIALKLVLEHRAVKSWEKLLNRLMTDKEIMAGVHLKFQNLYQEIEGPRYGAGRIAEIGKAALTGLRVCAERFASFGLADTSITMAP